MSGLKVLKKGEYLFKEGEKILSVWIIQSGQISLGLQKNKKYIEVMSAGAGYVFADLVILGLPNYSYSGLVMSETKVMEVPVESFKQQYDSLHQVNKAFVKGLCEKLKWSINEVKSSRFEKDPSACADEAIPKAFGTIFHVLNHKGLKEGTSSKIDWQTMRQYSQRIFGESLKRLEQATQLLVKVKMADYIYGKNPDDPNSKDEIQGFFLKDLNALESFFEFYQYYYFKGGKAELLRFDEGNYNFLRILTLAYDGVVPDKFGIVTKDFGEVTDFFKEYGINLGAGLFTALETKGLFCKRKPLADGKVHLQFEIKEFKTQQDIWKIIKEIDKWNEKGLIDMNDIDEGPKKKKVIDGLECTECSAVMILNSKFCSECGAKLVGQGTNSGVDRKAA